MGTGTEIVPVDKLGEMFPAIGNPDALEALTANLGEGDTVGVFDLDRVKIPAGGGTTWEVPTIEGDVATKELKGVIIATIARRAYWEESIDQGGGGTPPNCSSDDNKVGQGLYGVGSALHPKGTCADCPMNQFTEITPGRRIKPCQEQRLAVFLPEKSVLPLVIQLPVTSMKVMRTFMLRLASAEIPFYRAITAIELEKVKGKDTPDYSVVKPKLVGKIEDADAIAALKSMGDQIVAAYAAQTAAPTA